MNFLKGTATGPDGRAVAVGVSNQRTLLKFDDGRFAVRRGAFRGEHCPYLLFDAAVRLTVSVAGWSGLNSVDTTVDDYIPFGRGPQSLPNTCIESAEHVVKCLHANRHSAGRIANKKGARVSMSIGGDKTDIDVEDMNETASDRFPQGLDGAVDATNEVFEPGDGMALVYSLDPDDRDREWTVHAVAVLLKSAVVWDPFVIVSEVFAPDNGKAVRMTKGWNIACFQGAQDFKDAYFGCMPPSKYTLWKLSAAAR